VQLPGYWALSLTAKRPKNKTDHLFPPTAEVKNVWSYSLPQLRHDLIPRTESTLPY